MNQLVKVAAVSDLHGNLGFKVPQCDLLVIPGDICPVNESHHPVHQHHWLDKKFFPWCVDQLTSGVGHIVFTPGNHDFVFQQDHTVVYPQYVTCLIDTEATICGLRIYGTPWTTVFCNWAFMLSDARLRAKYSKIPHGLDILITHGPAYGVCDTVLSPAWEQEAEPLGPKELLRAVVKAKPRWHFFGHIHTGDHDTDYGTTNVANVSLVDEKYRETYPVFTTDMEVRTCK